MNFELEFHPDVIDDIQGAYGWYNNQLQGLGDILLDELENAYFSIQNFPNSWVNFQYGFKRYVLNKFPFSIIYKALNNKIYIIAVMHNSRKPAYWQNRIN